MENMINQDEVNALLAAEIRNSGLNDAIKLDVVREKVMKKIQEMSQGINEMENPTVAQGPTTFPNPEEEEEVINPEVNQSNVETPKIGMEAGAQPLGVSIEPRMAIAPEVPDFLKNVEPGKIFVYDFNELSVGGENLSIKPLKTLDNPEISKSMQQMWSENGTTRVEVYQAKFEKAGEIVYDYKNGTSVFIEQKPEPDYDLQKQYQQNPYAAEPEKEIENYLRSNVDLDQKINDVIANIVKSYFLTNTERAQVETPVYNQPQPQYQAPVVSNPTNAPQYTPIQEGSVTMKVLVNDFRKVDTPEELIETIQGKSEKAKLIYEDKEVKKWILNDKEYFLPSDPMSIRKCYIRENINELNDLNYKEWNPNIPYNILKKLDEFGSSCFRQTDSRTCSSYYILPDGFVIGGSSNYSLLPPVYGGVIKKNNRLFNRNNDDVTERYKNDASEYVNLSDSLKTFFNL